MHVEAVFAAEPPRGCVVQAMYTLSPKLPPEATASSHSQSEGGSASGMSVAAASAARCFDSGGGGAGTTAADIADNPAAKGKRKVGGTSGSGSARKKKRKAKLKEAKTQSCAALLAVLTTPGGSAVVAGAGIGVGAAVAAQTAFSSVFAAAFLSCNPKERNVGSKRMKFLKKDSGSQQYISGALQEFSKFRVADVYEYVWTQNKAISGVRVEEMEGKFGMLKQTAESGQMPGTYMQAVTITDKARLEEYLALASPFVLEMFLPVDSWQR